MKNAYSEIAAASRYDSARSLPAETKSLWLEALTAVIPKKKITRILDLGCGTGRFTAALGQEFGCAVIGVEPSAAMLEIARTESEPNIEWKKASAEDLPLAAESVDLVFMSQVFHHFVDPKQALQEIHRVLTRSGYLAIRNGMREENGNLAWLEFFPEARDIENQRTPSRQELKRTVGSQPFTLLAERTIHQLFAASVKEYFDKISQRGLSALIAISDEAFQAGLARFRDWVSCQPPGVPVYEPVDLFVFQKTVPGV